MSLALDPIEENKLEILQKENLELKRQLQQTNFLLQKISSQHQALIQSIPSPIAFIFRFLRRVINISKRIVDKKFLIKFYQVVKRRKFQSSFKETLVDWKKHVKEELQYDIWQNLYENKDIHVDSIISQKIEQFLFKPKISIILYFNSENKAQIPFFQQFIHDLEKQSYKDWELLLIVKGITKEELRTQQVLISKKLTKKAQWIYPQFDNEEFTFVKGEYFVFFSLSDRIFPHALYAVVSFLQEKPLPKFIYGDEDCIDIRGERFSPHIRPEWNLDLFLSQNYLGERVFFHSELFEQIGFPQMELEEACVYDFALRALDSLSDEHVLHVPWILHHKREGIKRLASREISKIQNERYALAKWLRDHNIDATVDDPSFNQKNKITHRIYWPLNQSPKVSILIATKDKIELLKPCVESILAKTDYSHYEIILVNNLSEKEETADYFKSVATNSKVKLLDYPHPFNFSAINNFAVQNSDGEIIVLLNNDTEVISSHWLSDTVAYLLRSDVGVVGAKLLYPDNTLQHAGILLGCGARETPIAGHYFPQLPDHSPGYYNRAQSAQCVSAVTGACLGITRKLYLELGGLDEANLKIAFNDVDLCLKVRAQGLKVIWSPDIRLYHKESQSRGYEDTAEKKQRFYDEAFAMRAKWANILDNDPYYSPLLNLEHWDFSIAEKPRVNWPWVVKDSKGFGAEKGT